MAQAADRMKRTRDGESESEEDNNEEEKKKSRKSCHKKKSPDDKPTRMAQAADRRKRTRDSESESEEDSSEKEKKKTKHRKSSKKKSRRSRHKKISSDDEATRMAQAADRRKRTRDSESESKSEEDSSEKEKKKKKHRKSSKKKSRRSRHKKIRITEPKLYKQAQSGAAENAKISPPELSFKIPEISELPEIFSDWENNKLPIDIVLFAVKDDEFLSCFAYLKEPIVTSYNKITGRVYFSSMEDDRGHKIEIALMRCSKVHDGPGGALSAAKRAISLLRPKALFSVGACRSLKSTKVKLGDVVVSSKLITPDFQIPPRKYLGDLIGNIADGWKAPLRNANDYKPKVHSGPLLSISKANEDIISDHRDAIAVEKNGGGFWAAAHDCNTEWLIIKGIKGFSNDSQSYSKEWKKFACVMAASVVANLLRNPVIFKDWPHFNEATSSSSAASRCTLS